jgi:hypothetical protein
MEKPMYCTILTNGAPHRYYSTKEAALKAAKAHYARTREGVEIAWCQETGNPKVWLAYVTPLGVEKTEHWIA